MASAPLNRVMGRDMAREKKKSTVLVPGINNRIMVSSSRMRRSMMNLFLYDGRECSFRIDIEKAMKKFYH